jgi:hypothetical protein
MWHHYFAVATDTITSCSLGRQYGPVFSRFFLDVYGFFPRILLPEAKAAKNLSQKKKK